MFQITGSWLMVPQPLWDLLLIGGGALTLLSVAAVNYCILKGKRRAIAPWVAVLAVSAAVLVLTYSGKIIGHMMVGGSVK